MTKGKIILVSILAFLLLVVSVLFGLVFRLREQAVSFIENEPRTEMTLDISKEQVISAAKLKKGGSIFMLDKDKAIKNIESEYPFLKVVQIKTKSLTKVEIIVQERHKLLYTTYNNTNDGKTHYYIMDKDLKILLTDSIDTEEYELIKNDRVEMSKVLKGNYIYIDGSNFKINTETKQFDCIGDGETQELISEMYNEIYRYAKIDGEYLNSSQIREIITEIKFDIGYTANGSAPYKRLILKTNVYSETFDKMCVYTIDIANPEKDLGQKINTCFSAMNNYLQEKEGGRISYYLTAQGEGLYGYFAE